MNARTRKRLRNRVFDAYGGPVCACCGETETVVLTVDHINGGGNQHRRQIQKENPVVYRGDGSMLRKWLSDNNFPPGFQVLCFNCNASKGGNNGVCHHQRNRREEHVA